MGGSKADVDFCLRDCDIADIEKRLDLKFSLIVTNVDDPACAYRTLHCSHDALHWERMANRCCLAMSHPHQVHNILTHAARAQESEPRTGLTVVVPITSAMDTSIFRGWDLVWQSKGIPVRAETADGALDQRRFTEFRAYTAWPINPPLPPHSLPPPPPLPETLTALPASSPLYMVFAAKLSKVNAILLADSGAADNYVSSAFCRRHGITYTSCPPESVALGDDVSTASVIGTCRLTVKIQGWNTTLPFRVINLNNAFGAIIGNGTLRKFHVVMNFGNATMSVKTRKGFITLESREKHAKRSRQKRPAPLHGAQIARAIRKKEQVFLACLKQVHGPDDRGPRLFAVLGEDGESEWNPEEYPEEEPEHEETTLENTPELVRPLLLEFADVFEAPPAGLPPERNAGHTIPLEPGHNPPFRPLYRLSPAERDEAERQVKEYLEKGWIL